MKERILLFSAGLILKGVRQEWDRGTGDELEIWYG